LGYFLYYNDLVNVVCEGTTCEGDSLTCLNCPQCPNCQVTCEGTTCKIPDTIEINLVNGSG